MVFLCVGTKNYILGYVTFEEYLLGVILVVCLEVIGLWHDRTISSKPVVFFRRQGYDGAPIRKDLGQLSCGSLLEDFYLRVSWRTPMCYFFIFMKV